MYFESLCAFEIGRGSLFSEEVFWSRFLSRYTTDVLRRCLEDFVISFVYFVKLKDSSDVTATVAIVRS